MEKMGLNEIREKYLSFFESKEHLRLPSFSLVPKQDKSLLLINAGMAPLKPYFTGLLVPPKKRVTTCQKCIRTGDIENVGITSRHATCFEMLGNFSFGDYFKKEVIPWAWEFVTEVLKLPKDRLYVTIYKDDDEAFDIWCNSTDIEPSRIFRLGKEDNFWEIGQGPCGPCSEIHFDRGEGKIETVEEFVEAGENDRVVEFWNLVFTQFDKDENGVYNKLAHPNIDTGMGLERIATIMQGKNSIFEVDTLENILNEVTKMSNVPYGKDGKHDISLRIITDHIRSVTFMISDGILPSNEGRGYVLRRLLRRAARHGRALSIKEAFLYKLCDVVIENSKGAYPELLEKADFIKKIIKLEEEKFEETIDSGIDILKSYVKELKDEGKNILSGEKAFKLYDTYGFPIELTEEILSDEGMEVDKDGFKEEMALQRKRAREARGETNYMGSEDNFASKLPKDLEIEFTGYKTINDNSEVLYIIKDGEEVSVLNEGEEGIIVTSKTPFYAEMGGQVGDKGTIKTSKGLFRVVDCKKNLGGKFIHYGFMERGSINLKDEVKLDVDKLRRNSIEKNHTATHMLQEALKEVLGSHVHQSGSYVDDERLRFDFTHFAPMSKEEIERAEDIVNAKVMEAIPVTTEVMSIDKAKESGAVALFDDKYKDEVRVVSVGSFSKELCGGTHVRNSGEIGLFKIISESGVASGVRRIEAITGFGSISYLKDKENLISDTAKVLKCADKELLTKSKALEEQIKNLQDELSSMKKKLAGGLEEEILNSAYKVGEVSVVTNVVHDIEAEDLRGLGDRLRNKTKCSVVVLGSINKGRLSFLSMADKDAVNHGVHCGKIVKEVAKIAGGGGGGRPDMAEAGGKIVEKAQDAISEVKNILEKSVK